MASSSPPTPLHGDGSSSSSDFEPSSKRSKQPSRRGGPRARDRGRGRGRGRGRARAGTTGRITRGRRRQTLGLQLSQEDFARIEALHAERIANEDARIGQLNLQQSHQFLRRALTKNPSLMLELAHETTGPQGPQPQPPAAQPTWCVCTNCREMPTDVENKCCGEPADSCIAMVQHMDQFILMEGVLYFAGRLWAEVRAEADVVGLGENNKRFRHAAYRQFVVWQYGALGQGRRVVIPSCCVWRIRDRYPDPHGQYRGFVPSRV